MRCVSCVTLTFQYPPPPSPLLPTPLSSTRKEKKASHPLLTLLPLPPPPLPSPILSEEKKGKKCQYDHGWASTQVSGYFSWGKQGLGSCSRGRGGRAFKNYTYTHISLKLFQILDFLSALVHLHFSSTAIAFKYRCEVKRLLLHL